MSSPKIQIDKELEAIVRYLRQRTNRHFLPNFDKENEIQFSVRSMTASYEPKLDGLYCLSKKVRCLIAEAECVEQSNVPIQQYHAGSYPSTKPHHFNIVSGRVVPKYWQSRQLVVNKDALIWLYTFIKYYALDYLTKTLCSLRDVESDIRLNHASQKKSVTSEQQELNRYFEHTDNCINELEHGITLIKQKLGYVRMLQSSQLVAPKCIPQTANWHKAMQIVASWFSPASCFSYIIDNLLYKQITMVKKSFLYERYVGLMLADSIGRMGWRVEGDPVFCAFLGGVLRFYHQTQTLEVWYEPRLNSKHPSGFTSSTYSDNNEYHHESTPDYFVVFKHQNKIVSSWLLDATLNGTNRDIKFKMGKYVYDKKLSCLANVNEDLYKLGGGVFSQQPVDFYGVRAYIKPKISWAISPIAGNETRIISSDGTIGILPLKPDKLKLNALDCFVDQIFQEMFNHKNGISA